MRIFLRYLDYLKRIILFFIKFMIAFFTIPFIKDRENFYKCWIISERGDEARDNGYHLFKYIRENNPNIRVYYIITKDSPDLEKIKKYNNLIYYGSLSHYRALIKSSHLISTHMYGYAEYGKACLPILKLLPKKKIIHLRHGIQYNSLNLDLNGLDLITLSSKTEKYIIQSINEYELPIKLTGMCRYDNLIDKSKLEKEKIVLIMPTFRSWLHDISRMPNKDILFKKEEYFKFYMNLLSDRDILRLCEENNLKIYFYPHYRIQQFLHNFNVDNKNVILAGREDYDIQDLLNKSSILITDYSSVFFDFAYMKKPIIYSQFDKKRFNSEHYKESEFSFKHNGFGEVVNDLEDIKIKLNHIIDNNFKMDCKYQERVSNFFEYNDRKNCKRVFNEIVNL